MRVLVCTAKLPPAAALLPLVSTALLTGGAPVARAETSKIFLELRDADSGAARAPHDEVLGQLRLALRAHGVVTEPARLAELPNERLPLDGHWDRSLTWADLTSQIDRGVRSYLRGNFEVATAQLEATLELIRRNPALAIRDAGARHWITRALVSLALTRLRSRDREGALDAMTQQISTFPDRPVRRDDFGDRGEALFREAKDQLERAPRGGLLVEAGEPGARIYVNERERGRGAGLALELAPGRYRVLVAVGELSRVYRVTVHADERARVTVDWRVDAALESSARWIGLRLPGGHADPAMLASLARRLAFHDAIFVGPHAPGYQRGLWGATYERGTGRRLRAGVLSTLASDPGAVRRFAAYLATGSGAEEFEAPARRPTTPRTAPSAPRAAPPDDGDPWLGAIFFGAGLASLGSGAYLAVAMGGAHCTGDRDACAPIAHASTWAIALLTGGAVSLGVATLLFLEDRAPAPSGRAHVHLIPMRAGGIATLGWQF
ncbi:MAG: hypothetical protein R3B48_18700 [Kofleriaceae bacterium]